MNDGGITILQWNCLGIYRKIPEIKRYLSSLDVSPDLLVLQETHIVERYSPIIHDYNIFRRDKSIFSGGLAIFMKQNLTEPEIATSASAHIELQCLQVSNLHVYNIYIHPECFLEEKDLEFFHKLRPRAILMGVCVCVCVYVFLWSL